MGPQQIIGMYADFNSLSMIRFFEPLINDVFKTCFEYCYFDENIFSSLEKANSVSKARQEITWNNPKLSHCDPMINQCEIEVHKIIHL